MLKLCGMTLAVVLFLWCSVDAKVEETMELRVFNHDFKPTRERMMEILEQADLEAHDFTKEVVMQEESSSSGKVISFEKMHRYYKSVPCYEAAAVERQLNELLSDALGLEVAAKVEEDMKTRRLYEGKKCRAGIEVHFDQKCNVKYMKRTRRVPCSWCLICWRLAIAN